MALSSFVDKTHCPAPEDLALMLGRTARLWRRLIDEVEARHGPCELEWNFGGEKYGWSLRIRRGARIALYLIPQERQFLVGIVLGDKAVRGAHEAGVDDAVLAMIDAAPRYAEGRGLRVPVAADAQLDAVLKVTSIKLAG